MVEQAIGGDTDGEEVERRTQMVYKSEKDHGCLLLETVHVLQRNAPRHKPISRGIGK